MAPSEMTWKLLHNAYMCKNSSARAQSLPEDGRDALGKQHRQDACATAADELAQEKTEPLHSSLAFSNFSRNQFDKPIEVGYNSANTRERMAVYKYQYHGGDFLNMVTMQDVAKHLKLSRATVSLVLNGRGKELRIKPETQKRITAAAKKLGFCRNEAARSMVSGNTRVICMMVRGLGGEWNSLCTESVIYETNREELFLKIATWNSLDNFRETIKRLMELHPLGFIFRDVNQKELAILKSELILNPTPTVLADDHPGCEKWAATVCFDDLSGFRALIGHLADLGHRRLGFLSWNPDSISFYQCYNHFLQVAKEMRITVRPDDCRFINIDETVEIDLTRDSATINAFARELAETRKNRPSAIICPADGIAYRLVKELEKCNIVVPRDLSVTGYGDSHVAKYGVPRLTTVKEFYKELGREAFKTLIKMIKAPSGKDFNRIIPVELVIGKTSAPANFLR